MDFICSFLRVDFGKETKANHQQTDFYKANGKTEHTFYDTNLNPNLRVCYKNVVNFFTKCFFFHLFCLNLT